MIRPDEIDATIQNALKERITQIFAPNAALDPTAARVKSAGLQAWREAAKRYASRYWTAGVLIASSILSAPLIAPFNEELWAVVFLGSFAVAMGLAINTSQKVRAELSRYVSPDVMRGAAHLISLSRAEQHYCDAVAALVDAGKILGEAPQKEILAQLNELLASHRKLEATLQQYQAGAAGQSVEQIEQELTALAQRRDQLTDTTARATAEQSLGLCRQRLEHAHRVEPVRERVVAQQDLILQTLASLQASLARITIAGTELPSTEVVGLRESVDQVNRQTHSVEEAVNEVMTLGAVG